MPASGATPAGTGYTGNQWYIKQWHYFVMPDAVEEALRSDGTAYTVVGDSNILAGALTNLDGSPKYPILISLGAEAIDDGEIAALTNYVAAGGFLFVGGSSFSRNTNGTTRGDFAIANAMGVHMVKPALTNWYFNDTFAISSNHRLVSSIPGGTLEWQMPESSEEISWPVDAHLTGETPNAVGPGLPHMLWQVQTTNATVIATGDAGIPYLLVQPYGRGCFIYDAALQPLLGHSGWAPGMYAYSIFRSAIQWAFQSSGVPVVKLSPWPYPYDAAVIFRHDMEAIPTNIISIERSAQFERTNGASGDYYLCTGTLRLDMPNPTFNNTLASLQRAMTNGASLYSHNGGLTNVNPIYNPRLTVIESNLTQLLSEGWLTAFEPYTFPVLAPLTTNNYDYWHWSPDEILGITNLLGGFTNASLYAFTSLSNSFNDMATWHLTNGNPLGWVAPYFNATKEGSYQIEQQLGVQMTGDDKLTPFPHWIFSTQTPDHYYSILSQPVSDWFIGDQVAQSMENSHTLATIQAAVDFYYNLGGLINLYCHSTSDGSGMDALLPGSYCTYSLSKPRIWSTNAAGIYNWWSRRSNALVTTSFSVIGGRSFTTLAISGNTVTNAAVELVAPSTAYVSLQVSTNGILAGTNVYRTNGLTIKLLVGTSVTNAVVSYILPPTVQDNFYQMAPGGSLAVSAPGVLSNGTVSATATLVSGPANGTLTFNPDGSFTYTPTNNYTGVDNFTYVAVSGSLTSAVATATIMITPAGELFYDIFSRNTIFPWVNQLGTWGVTNNVLVGSSSLNDYGYAYYNGNWTNYSVQAQIRFPATNAYGGALGGRLNPVTGARYTLWVYPENSPWPLLSGIPANRASMQIIKYAAWTGYQEQKLALLPGMGTNFHTVRMTFQGSNVFAYYDGSLITNLVDNGTFDGQPAYASGGIDVELYTQTTPFNMLVDNVLVSTETTANNDTYAGLENSTLHVSAPGILANDASGGGTLTALLVGGPAHGTLTLTNNGGFTYAPATNYIGTDSFAYKATDGQSTSSVATVTITLTSASYIPPAATNDTYTAITNGVLHTPSPGVLGNDGGGNGPLTAILSAGPAFGSLVLTNNGGFSYTPAAGFAGMDSFSYQATDGQSTSAVATVQLMVMPPGYAFYDGFFRPGNGNSIFPWVIELGGWSITNNCLFGTSSQDSYGYAYYQNAGWTDYAVQARIRYPTSSVWGGAIGGRLNPATGARYTVWVYPENSPWGPISGVPAGQATLQIIKYETWTAETDQKLVPLTTVGTNWHDIKLAFQGNNVAAYFDGSLITNLVDNGNFDTQPALTNGGISVEMYAATPYIMSVTNVAVFPLAFNPGYSTRENTALTVANPGVLSGDTDVYGTNLIAVLVSGPTNGTLILSSNGGFIYTPATNFAGTDGFTFQANDKLNHLGTNTASITVVAAPTLTVTASNQVRAYGTTNPIWTVSYTGFINGDGTNVLSGAPALTSGTDATSPIGNYVITVSQGTLGSTNYVFQFVNGTVTVNPAALIVTAKNTNKAYGQTMTFAGTEFSSSGLANGDTVSAVALASSGAVATAAVAGSPYAISATNATGSRLTNYAVSYQPGILTVNPATLIVAAKSTNKAYGQTVTFAGTEFTSSGLANGDTVSAVTLTSSGAAATAGVAGSPYAINVTNATGSGLANYTISYQPGVLTINPAGLAVTAGNTNKTYGQTVTFTGTEFVSSGLANGDTVSAVTLTSSGAAATAGVAGSPYAINVTSATGSGLANYTISYQPGVLTVNPAALKVTAGNTNKVYGQTVTFTGTEFASSNLLNGDTVSSAILASSGAAATAGVAGSPYAINVTSATGSGLANYTISYQPGVLTVNPAALTVTAADQTRMYSLTNPVLTASYNGFVNLENAGVLNGDPALNTTATSASPAGNYPITITSGTLSSDNYSFNFHAGILTVTPAPMPVILSFGLTNQVVIISWSSVAGATYGLQHATNLYNAIWNSLSPELTAAGPTASQTNAVGDAPQQFYRVMLVPAGP